jgi:hypothetical protein
MNKYTYDNEIIANIINLLKPCITESQYLRLCFLNNTGSLMCNITPRSYFRIGTINAADLAEWTYFAYELNHYWIDFSNSGDFDSFINSGSEDFFKLTDALKDYMTNGFSK